MEIGIGFLEFGWSSSVKMVDLNQTSPGFEPNSSSNMVLREALW
jgi:hypothetical protein